MPVLHDYAEFSGRHWETGSVRNALAYQGVTNPYTRKPISEALLLGLSGGAAFGYFVFDYAGTDPHVALLSRNTFDPVEVLFDRLAIPQDLLQTADPIKAERNLIELLETGRPVIIWADAFSLPYNALDHGEQMWAMNPIVVYGHQDELAYVADRSQAPLTLTADQLSNARARIKKDRFRALALGVPNFDRLPAAIEAAIQQCIALYTEPPPKGGRDSFGFAAFERLASMLTNTRNRQSWERLLPPGRRMFAALAGSGFQPGAFGWARVFPANQVQDKGRYADFLDEAAVILQRPGLEAAGQRFRAASQAWRELSDAMLPDDVPSFRRTRKLLLTKCELFISEGSSALEEIQDINARLRELRERIADEFPLSASQVVELRERLSEEVMRVAAIEREAVRQLQEAMR